MYLAASKHSHWIKNAAIDALEKWFCFALRYFRYQSQEWIRDLSQLQHRAINIALVTGLILVSFVLFRHTYYQVIFDLNKSAIVRLHATQFSTFSLCLCTGVCTHLCLFVASFAVCLAMTKNDLTEAYGHLENTTGDVRIALLLH